MNDHPQPKMTGADLKLHHEAIKREVMRVLDDVKLRQWAVDKVVELMSSTSISDVGIKETTQYFYNFVTNAKETDSAKSS